MIGYVDIDYADAYVNSHFVASSIQVSNWTALSESDKAVVLTKAFQSIENMAYTGRKTVDDQSTVFPRYPSTEVPNIVKEAQVEIALDFSDEEKVTSDEAYTLLGKYNVSSYSIGSLSESCTDGYWGSNPAQTASVTSKIALQLLKPFLSGGYHISRIWR